MLWRRRANVVRQGVRVRLWVRMRPGCRVHCVFGVATAAVVAATLGCCGVVHVIILIDAVEVTAGLILLVRVLWRGIVRMLAPRLLSIAAMRWMSEVLRLRDPLIRVVRHAAAAVTATSGSRCRPPRRTGIRKRRGWRARRGDVPSSALGTPARVLARLRGRGLGPRSSALASAAWLVAVVWVLSLVAHLLLFSETLPLLLVLLRLLPPSLADDL